ncbi:MAG: penicillin-binding protein 2 [bacterium]
MMDKQNSRIFILLAIFLSLFAIVILRLFDLQVLRHGFYVQKSLEQRTRLINLAAQRGDIYDRNGSILATSLDTYSVYQHNKGWLARKLDESQAKKLQENKPLKISVLKEKLRIYPKEQLAAQLLGFVGMDNQGLSGIELALDEYLRGKEGKVITESDPRGIELYGALREIQPGEDGMTLTLTIDENIQYVAEREIQKQIEKYRAQSGMCIVMDAKTGEILALASKPDFDPNDYNKSAKKLWHPSFLDPFEPGSAFKAITVAAALEEGLINDETRLKALEKIKVADRVIENAHEIDWPGKSISVSFMLEQSVNTGAVQLGLKLGAEKFYRQIKNFGFGERTNFGLWSESKGIVRHWKNWYQPDIAMITFGQSIAVTPLQLLSAYSAFANDGQLLNPFLVKKIESPDGRFVKVNSQRSRGQAVSAKTANAVSKMLNNVVNEGTGRPARIPGFAVCGKTGTAQKAILGGRGYLKDHYIASFIGYAPMKDPRLITLVIVDDPKGTYWGATVCGPVFQRVMEYSLRYLNVRPDML